MWHKTQPTPLRDLRHSATFRTSMRLFCKFVQHFCKRSASLGIGILWLLAPLQSAHAQSEIDLQSDLEACKSYAIIGGLPIDCDEAFRNAHLSPLKPHPTGVSWPTEAWETGDMPAESEPLVDALIAAAMARDKTDIMGETRAIIVIQNGPSSPKPIATASAQRPSKSPGRWRNQSPKPWSDGRSSLV